MLNMMGVPPGHHPLVRSVVLLGHGVRKVKLRIDNCQHSSVTSFSPTTDLSMSLGRFSQNFATQRDMLKFIMSYGVFICATRKFERQ